MTGGGGGGLLQPGVRVRNFESSWLGCGEPKVTC